MVSDNVVLQITREPDRLKVESGMQNCSGEEIFDILVALAGTLDNIAEMVVDLSIQKGYGGTKEGLMNMAFAAARDDKVTGGHSFMVMKDGEKQGSDAKSDRKE
jgi:hypothetical protein